MYITDFFKYPFSLIYTLPGIVIMTESFNFMIFFHLDFVILSNKILNMIVAVVCRQFKTNDEAVFVWRIYLGNQHLEAIIAICKFGRFD